MMPAMLLVRVITAEELATSETCLYSAFMQQRCSIPSKVGLCNLKHIGAAIADRKKIYEHYRHRLANIDNIRIIEEGLTENKNYAYLPVEIKGTALGLRNDIYNTLKDNRIHARKYFYPITADQACFRNRYKNDNLESARRLSDNVLVLPIYEGLEISDVDRIVDIINECL